MKKKNAVFEDRGCRKVGLFRKIEGNTGALKGRLDYSSVALGISHYNNDIAIFRGACRYSYRMYCSFRYKIRKKRRGGNGASFW